MDGAAEASDLNHLIPVSVHPNNELWNLVPSDPWHNMRVKRARIPTSVHPEEAIPILTRTYVPYGGSLGLSGNLQPDMQGNLGEPSIPPIC